MTAIELIHLLRKIKGKGKDVKCIGSEGVITEVEEHENEIILK